MLRIHLLNLYKRLGLANKNQLWTLQTEQKKDAYACIQWVRNREKLESLGFSLENLKIDEGKKY
jgi:hypothetical protein